MRRKRMAKGVRGDMLGDSRLLDVMAKDLPRAHARQRRASRIQKQDALSPSLFELWAQLAKVNGHRPNGPPANRHQALLRAFAEHPDETFLERNVSNRKRDPFGDAQASPIRQFEQRAITEGHGLV